jgi:hypothetical protein
MRPLALAVTLSTALALVFSAGAGAAPTADVMAPIQQFVDAFNKGETKTAFSACAPTTSIIDEFPPHEWHGSTACADWDTALDAFNKKNAITDTIVTLGKPLHVDVTGDRAYVVLPASYAYKDHGKAAAEKGSILTVALQKIAGVWRMTGWAWARR